MPARRAVLAPASALASALAVAAVLGLAGLAGTAAGASTAAHGRAQAVRAWWATVQPAYATFQRDVATAGHAIGHYTLPAFASACRKLTGDARALRDEAPVPDRAINARWQSGLRAYGRGASACARGVPSKTSVLMKQATHDITIGKAKLAKAVGEIRALGGAPQASTSSIRSSSQ